MSSDLYDLIGDYAGDNTAIPIPDVGNDVKVFPAGTKLEFHPLSEQQPEQTEEEFQGLLKSIEIDGQNEPVLIFEDMILDGRHRYQALNYLEMEIKYKLFGGTYQEAMAYAFSSGLRRNLTPAQRAMMVVMSPICDEMYAQSERKKQANLSQNSPIGEDVTLSDEKTSEILASMAGVSYKSVETAKRILGANPECALEVFHGKRSLGSAKNLLFPMKPKRSPYEQALKCGPTITKLGIPKAKRKEATEKLQNFMKELAAEYTK